MVLIFSTFRVNADNRIGSIRSIPINRQSPRKASNVVNQTKTVYRTHQYAFLSHPGGNHARKIKPNNYYDKKIRFNRLVKNPQGTFVKTRHGWLNYNSFYQWYLAYGKVNVRTRIDQNADLYNRPWGTKDAQVITNARKLGLVNRWIDPDLVAYTNTHHVYYRFNHQQKRYWIEARNLSFDLKHLKRSHSHRLEKALAAGERLIGHSKYYEQGSGYDPEAKRFDCSEFVRWLFAKAGVVLGPNTFTQYRDGRHVRASHLRRGDIFFFDDKDQGRLCHVGIYLGRHLFLHDSPDSNTGGVGISSLKDPFWRPRFDYIVRRVI